MENLYKWAIDFLNSIGEIYDWLFTPIEILDLNLAPAYLVVGAAATIGLIRRIL